MYDWLPPKAAPPLIPPGPALKFCVCVLAAAAPKPPNGPWALKACAWAFAAPAPKPFGPKCCPCEAALAKALDDP